MGALGVLTAVSAGTLSASDFSLKAGLGYEFLSQRYFLDSAALSGPDSTLAAWSLTSTYLDDLKGHITASWRPLSDLQKLEWRTSLEQTADFLRLKTAGSVRLRPGRNRLDLDAEAEWRDRVGNSGDFGDSYLLTYTRAKGSTPITASLSAVGRLRAETVDFHSGATAPLDYVRLSGNLGVEKTFPDYSWGEFSLLFTARRVPDSTSMDYRSIGFEGAFYGFLPIGQLDLYARFESKDYSQPEDRDDHLRAEVYGRNQIELGGRWFSREEFDLEGMFYRNQVWLSTDYLKLGGAALLGAETDGLAVAAGPDVEVLTTPGDVSAGLILEDYWEAGCKLDLDYLGPNGIYFSLESITGYRTLRYQTEVQTSFWYERVYLMGDIRIASGLNLSTLFSAEWERHSDSGDNSDLYLLSTSLTYAF